MTMKKTRNVLTAILAATVLLLAACSPATPIATPTSSAAATQAPAATQEAAATAAETAAPTQPQQPAEAVTLTYYCDNLGNTIIQSFNDNIAYKKAMEITGINIQFQHAAAGQFSQQLGTMIASNALPDIVDGFSYQKGPDAAMSDGLILKLNDLVNSDGPNFLRVVNSNPEIKRQTLTDAGDFWCVPCIQPHEEDAWRGLSIRKDLLDKLGIAMPTTVPEYEAALKALKDSGVKDPLSMAIKTSGTPFSDDGYFVAAFGIGAAFYKDQSTGTVKYGPLEDSYKDFLALMNKWYKDGLLDPDFNTRTGDDLNKMVVTGDIASCILGYGPTLTNQNNGAANNSSFLLAQIPNLPNNAGKTVQYRNTNFLVKGNYTIISANCKNPNAAMKWLDFGFTDEGSMLFNYGVEGVSYTMVDGKPQWTDAMTNGVEGAWVNIRDKYKRHQGPYLRDWAAFPMTEFEKTCAETWTKAGNAMVLPPFTRSAEENEKYGTLMSDINTYADENITNFIKGSMSLDKFDQFRAQLKSMGIEDAIAIQQAALDRYNNRGK